MGQSQRMDRVSRQIQSVLAEIIQEGLKDPRVGPVTVTSVRVSPDLRHAHVGFLPLGGIGDPVTIEQGLNAAKGYIQRQLSRRVRMKYLPVLEFHVDTTIAKAMAIEMLIDDLAREREE
jgi:ribosome-binding factor A